MPCANSPSNDINGLLQSGDSLVVKGSGRNMQDLQTAHAGAEAAFNLPQFLRKKDVWPKSRLFCDRGFDARLVQG